MKPIGFIIKGKVEHLISRSGQALMSVFMGRPSLVERFYDVCLSGCQDPDISHADILKSVIDLLHMRKPNYAVIEKFLNDLFFWYSLGIKRCLSNSTLRKRLLDVVHGGFSCIVKWELASEGL